VCQGRLRRLYNVRIRGRDRIDKGRISVRYQSEEDES